MTGLASSSAAAPTDTPADKVGCTRTDRCCVSPRDIGFALDRHARRRSDDLEIVAFHHPVLDPHVAGDFVEGKALGEQVLKIEGEPPLERLQRKNAQQLAEAGIELGELAAPGLEAKRAVERRIVEVLRPTLPRNLAADPGRGVADGIRQRVPRQVLAGIVHVEVGVQRRLLVAAPPRHQPLASSRPSSLISLRLSMRQSAPSGCAFNSSRPRS